MISFACLVPHSPVIIPEIGKENTVRLKKTIFSYQKLAQALKDSDATTIIVISPHGESLDKAMLINQNVAYRADFSEFGYLGAQEKWDGNMGLAQKLKTACEPKDNLRLYTSDHVNYGTAVPLLMLAKNAAGRKIIPLFCSGLSNAEHFEFGKTIGPLLLAEEEKIALVASGDLSHCLSKEAPAKYSPRGAKFDHKLKEVLKNKKTAELLALPADLIADAAECGLKPILVLMGILDGKGYEPKTLSYEAPFGIGYLCMDFRLFAS